MNRNILDKPPKEEKQDIYFWGGEKVKRYLASMTKRVSISDDEEEYSIGESKMIKTDSKYGVKPLNIITIKTNFKIMMIMIQMN